MTMLIKDLHTLSTDIEKFILDKLPYMAFEEKFLSLDFTPAEARSAEGKWWNTAAHLQALQEIKNQRLDCFIRNCLGFTDRNFNYKKHIYSVVKNIPENILFGLRCLDASINMLNKRETHCKNKTAFDPKDHIVDALKQTGIPHSNLIKAEECASEIVADVNWSKRSSSEAAARGSSVTWSDDTRSGLYSLHSNICDMIFNQTKNLNEFCEVWIKSFRLETKCAVYMSGIPFHSEDFDDKMFNKVFVDDIYLRALVINDHLKPSQTIFKRK